MTVQLSQLRSGFMMNNRKLPVIARRTAEPADEAIFWFQKNVYITTLAPQSRASCAERPASSVQRRAPFVQQSLSEAGVAPFCLCAFVPLRHSLIIPTLVPQSPVDE
jgi:hypothetical protein